MATKPAPFNISPPPLPTIPDISQFVDTAKKQLDPGFSEVTNAVTSAASQQKTTLDTLAGQQTDQITTVQKQYADLAKEFETEQGLETKTTTEAGEANIGVAQVAMAKSGVDPSAQGAFASPVVGAQKDLQGRVADLANKYGAKQQELTDTLASNVQQLQQKAQQYQLQGNQVMADAVTQVAQLKYQHEQEITSLAQQMSAATSTWEQSMWKDYMDEVNAQHQQATLDVMEQRLAQAAAKADRTFAIEEQRLGLEEQSQKNTEAKDQQTILNEYGKALSGFAKNIKVNASQTSGVTREAAINELAQQFPELDLQSIKNDVYSTYSDSYAP